MSTEREMLRCAGEALQDMITRYDDLADMYDKQADKYSACADRVLSLQEQVASLTRELTNERDAIKCLNHWAQTKTNERDRAVIAMREILPALERRLKSDDSCGHPFDEDLGSALNIAKAALDA